MPTVTTATRPTWSCRSGGGSAGDGAGPWDYGLALLVDSAAYPPHVGAIHRVIPGLDTGQAIRLAAGAFTVRELPGGTADLTAAVQQLDAAARRGVAFLVAGDGRAALLTDPDPAQLAAAMAGQPGCGSGCPPRCCRSCSWTGCGRCAMTRHGPGHPRPGDGAPRGGRGAGHDDGAVLPDDRSRRL